MSCVEFNDDGEFLATGDKGGRVVIFSRDKEKDEVSMNDKARPLYYCSSSVRS